MKGNNARNEHLCFNKKERKTMTSEIMDNFNLEMT